MLTAAILALGMHKEGSVLGRFLGQRPDIRANCFWILAFDVNLL